MADSGVVNRFLRQLLRDRLSGERRSLEHYQARFPGAEEVIADAYRGEMPGGSGDSSAATGPDSAEFGPYRIIRLLGRGGQATVYLAEDRRLHREVALKLLRAAGLESPEGLLRFQREAEVASHLDHPGICTVYEAGVQDGVPFIAMRYVEGRPLARAISEAVELGTSTSVPIDSLDGDERPALASRESTTGETTRRKRDRLMRVVEIVEKSARALHSAHERGVIHRDIKPANIMVDQNGDPVITDFGLAREEDSSIPTITRTGELFGTPAYMSPEQLTRQAIQLDRRTDVWSLGATLYECLTLHRPFETPTREGLYQAILTREPPDPRRLNAAVPRDLAVVLATALQKDRDRRYQTALDLAEDLRRVRQGEPIRARPVTPLVRLARWIRREPAKASAVALAFALIATGGYLVARWSDIQAGLEQARSERIESLLEDAYLELGKGSAQRSLETFQAVLSEDPSNPEAVGGLARSHLNLGRHDRALAIFDEHPEVMAANPGLERIRADALRKGGDPEAAEKIENALPEPRSGLGWLLLGLVEIERGHLGDSTAYQRATRAFDRAVTMAPRSISFHHLLHALAHLQDRERVPFLSDLVTRRWPESPQAWIWSGFALLRIGKCDAALRCFDEALRLRPRAGLAMVFKAEALQELKRHPEAEEVLEKAAALAPEDADRWFDLATVRARQGKREETWKAADEAVRLMPDNATRHARLGDLHYALGFPEPHTPDPEEMAAATAEYRKAIEMGRDHPDTWHNLGLSLDFSARYDEAIEAYERAMSFGPRPKLHNNLSIRLAARGCHLMQEGRIEEAIADFRRILEFWPDHAETHCLLGFARRYQGQLRESLAEIQRGYELGSADPNWEKLPLAQQWLDEAQDLVQLETRLDAATADRSEIEELMALMPLCRLQRRYADAATLWRNAFARDPSMAADIAGGHRLRAARFAILAGTAHDRGDLSPASQAAWRAQALAWSREELGAVQAALGAEGLPEPRARQILERWLDDSDLVLTRDEQHLSQLPEDEQPAWRALWTELRTLRDELR